jgi:thioredoxin reductase (NADPH)
LEMDVLIIGAGPAGLTAGIYAARMGLKGLIFEKGVAGGMLREAPWIENYPGEKRVSGNELADRMRDQTKELIEIREGEEVLSVGKEGEDFIVKTTWGSYTGRGIIFATGTQRRRLGVPGELELLGRGVSYCAVCDGPLFRNKTVAVVGGGNSAAMEALHLRELGCKVFLIHRRGELRAEAHLQERLEGVTLKLNRVVEEILGEDSVRGLRLADPRTGEREELQVEGVFISVGEEPNSSLAASLGVELEGGYIKVDGRQRTNVPRVYAAGDVTGQVRQVVVACSQGAVAALSAFEDLRSPYWRK